MEINLSAAISRLKKGQAPNHDEALQKITVGLRPFVHFLKDRYFLEYIARGGSKIKFVTGRAGSGKTHFLQLLSSEAEKAGFITVCFSARTIWLHDFKEIYTEIFRRSHLMECLKRCAKQIIREMGYDASIVPDSMTFVDYLSSQGELDALTKKEIRNQLQQMFLKNSLIDNNFAVACSLLTGSLLGHPTLEEPNRDLLLLWLSGSKEANLASLRRLGLSPAKITRYNARHMLRSLAEVQSLADYPGMLILIDEVDILAESGPLDTIRYTRLKREDAYESIRELIDEIDTLKHVMIFYAFRKSLIEDDRNGLKSYLALWMRIQNEIVSDKFNQFTDIIDLDALGKIVYTKEALLAMSQKLAELVSPVCHDAAPIDAQQADELLSNAQFTQVALPRQVVRMTVDRMRDATLYSEEEGHDRF